MLAEKKEEYLMKQRKYRQLKKIAPLNLNSLDEPDQLRGQGIKHTNLIYLSIYLVVHKTDKMTSWRSFRPT